MPWNFFLKRSFWTSKQAAASQKSQAEPLLQPSEADEEAMVVVQNLRKVFPTTDGFQKVAVDDLNLTMRRNKITGLLGE